MTEVSVPMGRLAVHSVEEAPAGLAVFGLGSCVAVFLHDPRSRLGGLAHIFLPGQRNVGEISPTSPAVWAGSGVAALARAMLARGARRETLIAKVAGGSRMFRRLDPFRDGIGERNVHAVLEALRAESIAVVSTDVGGTHGRCLVADLETGRVLITSARRAPKQI